jgi:hypothetical protein
MADWEQAPDALRVACLSAPSGPELSEDEALERALQYIGNDIYYAYYTTRIFQNVGDGAMDEPRSPAAAGGLVSQLGSHGHYVLGDDDAVVITASAGSASYRSIVLHDMWLTSLEYREHQSSLTNAQMAPDADGRFTYVISLRDPGVHNWLDTAGTHEVLVLHRWQGFPHESAGAVPTITSRQIKLAELSSALPPGVARVDAAQRRAQLAKRAADYDRRFAAD